jgi:hypothetical protein
MNKALVRVTVVYEELPDSGCRVPRPGDYFMWKPNGIIHYCVDDTDTDNASVGWSPASEYRLFKVTAQDEQLF